MKIRAEILIVAIGLSSFSFGAEDGIKVGAMTVHPFVAGEVTYDDNVFQEADGRDDTYYELGIGTRVKRETDSLVFDSSLWLAQRLYTTYGDEKDGLRYGIAGMLRGETDKSFGSAMVNVRQVEDYDMAPAMGSIPAGFEGTVDRAFDRTASSEPRRIVDAMLGGGYDVSDAVNVMLGYKFYVVDYYDNPVGIHGWNEHMVGADLSFKATDKMFAFANVQLGIQDGDGAPNGEAAHVAVARLGVKNRLSDKSTARFSVGVMRYETDLDEYTEPSFDANVTWKSSEKITLFINGRNEVQPVGDGTTVQLSTRASAGANYIASRSASMILSGSYIYDKWLDNDTSGNKPELNMAIGTFRVNVYPVKQVQLFAQLEYTNAKQDVGDDYDRFRGALGAVYAF